MNGFRQEGFAAFDRNISPRPAAVRGARVPAPGDVPAQPQVVTCAHITRILFDGTRATGAEFVLRVTAGSSPRSAQRRVYGGEVIVCAGAFNSPQLLQLSGVGNATNSHRSA